ncbi:MAG TPA: hypothetical protein VGF02_01745 [Pseudolabrys sp.]|jgi:hypothetical protein
MPRRLSISLSVSAALAAAMLAGCASDDATSRLLVAPDKYVLYSCAEIAREMQAKAKREQELAVLMAKAGDDASARVISGMTYDPEYLSVRGEMNDLRASATAKDCNAPAAAPAPTASPAAAAKRSQ